MQAKLLRALQERCFFRLGAERPTRSDFRVIAATNRDLHADLDAGRFREDLFYRLAVIKIHLPPLRERPEDIRWLAQRMSGQMAAEQGRPLAISDALLQALVRHSWRGNARELRAFLEQAVVFSDNGLLDIDTVALAPLDVEPTETNGAEIIAPLHRLLESVERAHIQKALRHCDGSVGRTATLLGISRKTLWEKTKRLGLQN